MQYKLTEFSHGAGCGCKLSPGVLSDILGPNSALPQFKNLLVGNEDKDDAAVVSLDGQTAIVSTTDFFMPIVDDPYDFGAIAATNALSDIYAMGASPIMAIAILGWPIDKLPAKVASQVLQGGRDICTKAGIPLAGGHSIDSPEPIFGLAVTGKVSIEQIKKNKDGKEGDLLYLTKPIGIGIATTAQKKKVVEEKDLETAKESMLTLNLIGQDLGKLPYVNAITDVTGFGLAGHLLEVCNAGGLGATLHFNKIPVFDFVANYLAMDCVPGGTYRNWKAYGNEFSLKKPDNFKIIADPQTSGGLLITVDPKHQEAFESFLLANGLDLKPIGSLNARPSGQVVSVN